MDGNRLDQSFNEISLRELFRSQLPTYLAIGMSPDEFWHGDPNLTVAYREAEYIRRDNLRIAEWRQGRYVYEALARTAPMFNPMARDHKAIDYPDEPIFSLTNDDADSEEKAEKARMDRQKAFVETFMVNHNMKLQKTD